MKRWGLLVCLLYCLILIILTAPAGLLILSPDANVHRFGSPVLSGSYWYSEGGYWCWLAVMFIAQWAFLAVPVRAAERGPLTRRPLWLTILAGGLMAGGLAAGAILSIVEIIIGERVLHDRWLWVAVTLGLLAWCAWAFIFFRSSRNANPEDVSSRQSHWLLKGSILELLIAVPCHVVARHRNYCCAGVVTFLGLTAGFAVMLFSFGPAVFFLYSERWRRLYPPRQTREMLN